MARLIDAERKEQTMRPIDADALKEKYTMVTKRYSGGIMECPAVLLKSIDSAPTIDAVSVVRGEWMPNPKIGWGETWVCSICGEKTTSSVMGYPRYNYCPMCGAKMKGADDEI